MVAVSAVVFGAAAGAAPVGLLVGAAVAPVVLELPDAGVVDAAGVVAGSVVSGVGSGGNGLDITLAIRSVKPASD